MRTFKNYMDAAKRRKLEETGEEGFSLIELIIVVVILGILVAIAIPLFGNIQQTAQQNALSAAAANAATAVAAAIGDSDTTSTPTTALDNASDGQFAVTLNPAVWSRLHGRRQQLDSVAADRTPRGPTAARGNAASALENPSSDTPSTLKG
jgi:prepilin-type N-terminal cleavage/methylation domain-containing protein